MNIYYWIALAVAAAVISVFFPHLLPWVMGIWPVPAGTSPWYQFWSGFFIVVLSVAGAQWARKQNCHVEWCWRSGRYPVADGAFTVCKRHHPDPAVRDSKITHEHIIHLHRKHMAEQGITIEVNELQLTWMRNSTSPC